ncbi:hypothetical protein BN871_CQ_00010, partial [Paenibacillus sp. P22]
MAPSAEAADNGELMEPNIKAAAKKTLQKMPMILTLRYMLNQPPLCHSGGL